MKQVLNSCWDIISQELISHTIGWLEFNVPFQHKYGYTRDDSDAVDQWSKCLLYVIHFLDGHTEHCFC